jgi:hypothetical protein
MPPCQGHTGWACVAQGLCVTIESSETQAKGRRFSHPLGFPPMATSTFDTHKFIRRLKESGIPETQAEAIAVAFSDAHIEADLAAKAGLCELEYRLAIKLGGMMMMASIAVVATWVKLP